MFLILGFLASICCVVAIPLTWGLWKIVTSPAPTTSTTQTGQSYYCELIPADGEHLPVRYPIEDAIIEESDLERVKRIRERIKQDVATLTPSKTTKAPEPIRKYADRERVDIDHDLKIIK